MHLSDEMQRSPLSNFMAKSFQTRDPCWFETCDFIVFLPRSPLARSLHPTPCLSTSPLDSGRLSLMFS